MSQSSQQCVITCSSHCFSCPHLCILHETPSIKKKTEQYSSYVRIINFIQVFILLFKTQPIITQDLTQSEAEDH